VSFSNNGHLAPRFSCARLQSSQTRGADIKRSLRSSVAALGLLALVASGAASPALTQGSPQAERKPDNLAPVLVPPPQRKPLRQAESGTQRVRTPARVAGRPRCAGRGRSGHYRRAERTANTAQYQCRNRGRSRLGLTVRQTPATVEVIDKQVIEDRGLRTTTDVAKAATGVTGGDAPGAPAIFSMRGFGRRPDQHALQRHLDRPVDHDGTSDGHRQSRPGRDLEGAGPRCLSGIGATGGAINYVTKAPHTGPIVNDAFTSFDSFKGYRAGYGSGGSTLVDGLDYRFDISHSNNVGFIDDTYSKLSNVSGQLNYRVSDNFRIWGAAEYKQDKDRFYWGTRWYRPMRRELSRPAESSRGFGPITILMATPVP